MRYWKITDALRLNRLFTDQGGKNFSKSPAIKSTHAALFGRQPVVYLRATEAVYKGQCPSARLSECFYPFIRYLKQ